MGLPPGRAARLPVLALDVLRVFVGGFLVYHGLLYAFHMSEFSTKVAGFGVPLSGATAALTVLALLAFGALLLLDRFTPEVGLATSVLMLLIFLVAHAPGGFNVTIFSPGLDGEEELFYLASGLVIALASGARSTRITRRAAPAGLTANHSTAAVTLLRIYVGVLLVYHGLEQIWRMDDFTAKVARQGAPFPAAAAWLTMLGEIGLGLLLALGLATRLAGFLTMTLMTLIFINAYILGTEGSPLTPRQDSLTLHGIESLAYAVAGFVLLCTGPGRYALDGRLTRWRTRHAPPKVSATTVA